jgi:hypothetical protein
VIYQSRFKIIFVPLEIASRFCTASEVSQAAESRP